MSRIEDLGLAVRRNQQISKSAGFNNVSRTGLLCHPDGKSETLWIIRGVRNIDTKQKQNPQTLEPYLGLLGTRILNEGPGEARLRDAGFKPGLITSEAKRGGCNGSSTSNALIHAFVS